MARRMTARYPGTCAAGCGTQIDPGDLIVFDPPTRRTRHQACGRVDGRPTVDPLADLPLGVKEEYVAWLGEILMEEGTAEAAWFLIEQLNEHWDGEEDPRRHARMEFERALPFALAQNRAIHG
jgi:hypothetical protein